MFVSVRNSIGWENITSFKIWLSIKNGISRSESGKNKSCSRKGCWRIEKLYDIRKEQQQEQLLKAMMSGKRSFEEILKSISDDTAFKCGSIFAF